MKRKNFLDFYPVKNSEYTWEEREDTVVISVKNRGLFNAIARLIRKTPRVSFIHMDEYGSFVWKCIDGEKTVFEIAARIKEKYGEAAEPIYSRLVKYMRILSRGGFVKFREGNKSG